MCTVALGRRRQCKVVFLSEEYHNPHLPPTISESPHTPSFLNKKMTLVLHCLGYIFVKVYLKVYITFAACLVDRRGLARLRLWVSAMLQQNLCTRGTARSTGVKQRGHSIDGGSVHLTHKHNTTQHHTPFTTQRIRYERSPPMLHGN